MSLYAVLDLKGNIIKQSVAANRSLAWILAYGYHLYKIDKYRHSGAIDLTRVFRRDGYKCVPVKVVKIPE